MIYRQSEFPAPYVHNVKLLHPHHPSKEGRVDETNELTHHGRAGKEELGVIRQHFAHVGHRREILVKGVPEIVFHKTEPSSRIALHLEDVPALLPVEPFGLLAVQPALPSAWGHIEVNLDPVGTPRGPLGCRRAPLPILVHLLRRIASGTTHQYAEAGPIRQGPELGEGLILPPTVHHVRQLLLVVMDNIRAGVEHLSVREGVIAHPVHGVGEDTRTRLEVVVQVAAAPAMVPPQPGAGLGHGRGGKQARHRGGGDGFEAQLPFSLPPAAFKRRRRGHDRFTQSRIRLFTQSRILSHFCENYAFAWESKRLDDRRQLAYGAHIRCR
mmetsp:Transcript_24082/g.71003  ORF Transcript_24082/g.71003 Transcript_24082/m.71003 type:complete len:326 (+) Transcript_24082:833-1810(+)